MSTEFIRANWLGKLFGNITHLKFDEIKLVLYRDEKLIKQYMWADLGGYPDIKYGILGSKLNFKNVIFFKKLNFLKAADLKKTEARLTQYISKVIQKNVQDCENELIKYAVKEYLRDSNIKKLEQQINPTLDKFKNQKIEWEKNLPANTMRFLEKYVEYFPIEFGVSKLREEYEKKMLKKRQFFYDKAETNPLTQEQRLAVIRDNNRNLVLAAAGTGKTSVIVAKALDLIDRNVTKSKNILILAYNKAAAVELKERLVARSANLNLGEELIPDISTFHALGRQILLETKASVRLSKFAEDPKKLENWLSKWFSDKIKADEKFAIAFINLSVQPVNFFDFKNKEEYDAYVRDNEYRTLQGDLVRGYQELLISNWLYLNGIDHQYEPRYVSKRRIEIGFNYSPDFYIEYAGVYLEHFGIERDGSTRCDIDSIKYNQDIEKKRRLHEECGTTLIETYHYNWTEGNLESVLQQHIQELGVPIKKLSKEEIFEKLKENGFLLNGVKLYLKCLQAIRVEQLSDEEIHNRLSEHQIVFADEFKKLLTDVHLSYKEELKNQEAIDFDDMIIRASLAVKNDKFLPKWTHILVDEFQDISGSRMQFLDQLVQKGNDPVLTAVGDDWQSIYRFSGGKLELTTQFENRVGSASITKLLKTFRYNNSIAQTAGRFVMQNPEQYKKKVTTHTQVDAPQVYLLDSMVDKQENLALRTVQIIQEILSDDPDASIAVLSRYRYLLADAKSEVSKCYKKNIKYWTFHGSKGLEAEYCVLIGFFQGKTGFPNENKEDAIVEALLPSLDTFPHSEERRLLYVGITRAKKKSYLIADPRATSEFIVELLSPNYELCIASKRFEKKYREIFKCHSCSTGYFKLRKGKFGDFYSCTSGKICNSKPRICTKCGSPSTDGKDVSTCNNTDCAAMLKICDKCGRPMKKRKGKFGEFWGCTGYGIKDDQCKNTSKISSFLGIEL
jgi:DNA helicase IV